MVKDLIYLLHRHKGIDHDNTTRFQTGTKRLPLLILMEDAEQITHDNDSNTSTRLPDTYDVRLSLYGTKHKTKTYLAVFLRMVPMYFPLNRPSRGRTG